MSNPITPTRRALLAAAGLAGGAAVSGAGPAGASQATPYVLPFTTVLPLGAAANGADYQLYVRTPPAYDANPDKRYPVIVTLDADYAFAICANHLEHLADRMNQAPEAILVSVAYAGVYPDRRRYQLERSRDYTPVFFPTGGYGEEAQRQSGGGPAFLRFLLDVALPAVEARWRTQAGERTLVGHSYGGLFAAWVLQHRPDAFNRYLMVSPSLWYADTLILKREAAGEITRPTRPTLAYIAVGSWEEQPENRGFMVSQAQEFGRLLTARRDPLLEHELRVFEDETHASIFPAAFSTGVRRLF